MNISTIIADKATVTLPDGTIIKADNIKLTTTQSVDVKIDNTPTTIEDNGTELIGFLDYKDDKVCLLLSNSAIDTYLNKRTVSHTLIEVINTAINYDLGNGIRYYWTEDEWLAIPQPIRKYLSELPCLASNTLPSHLLDDVAPTDVSPNDASKTTVPVWEPEYEFEITIAKQFKANWYSVGVSSRLSSDLLDAIHKAKMITDNDNYSRATSVTYLWTKDVWKTIGYEARGYLMQTKEDGRFALPVSDTDEPTEDLTACGSLVMNSDEVILTLYNPSLYESDTMPDINDALSAATVVYDDSNGHGHYSWDLKTWDNLPTSSTEAINRLPGIAKSANISYAISTKKGK